MKIFNLFLISAKIRYNNYLLNKIQTVKQDVVNTLEKIELYEQQIKSSK